MTRARSTEPTAAPTADLDELASLASLAETFAVDFRDHAGPPVAVGVLPPDDPAGGDTEKGSLCVCELYDGDPAREMLGWRAPREWVAFGIASRARTRHLDTGEVRDEHAGMAHVVSRSGGVAYALATPDRDVLVHRDEHDTSEGRMADTCRRVLGLVTPPPRHDSRALLAAQWLDAVAARAMAARPGSLTWDEVVLANPNVTRIVAADPLLALELPDRLLEFGNAWRRAWPWSRLRAEHRSGRYPGFDLEPAHSAWMDDGMFARWALSWYPPMQHLLEVVDERVSSAVRERIRRTLADWALTDGRSDTAAP